ncbi:ornithine carbamoyltransferase [Desulfopila aestuarii]|uniref:Ornithine carbamoyltransferase n=1 Tax=Desulfopila aestuarii DSM 18488 TaxID=1121416 RepID=A0A1M7Y5U5_9BACT|nr:ornithine carbamoyltransferase [Desulfopila aestuarii]SHO47908.1 ornithine carbamoyltransferase [Desulfopila aestuarii DSM 18488]
MNTNKRNVKHLIDWNDWSDQEVKEVLDFASRIKHNRWSYQGYMTGKTLVMLFQKTSTRTRISFEASMTEMGGHAIFLDWMTSNFKLSKISYETAYLSRNAAIIMARVKEHKDLLEMKSTASVPLINGCCNMYHPCQAMADMLTIHEDRGSLEGAKLTYIGVHNNVVNSLMSASAALGVELTLVCPISDESEVDQTSKAKLKSKGLLIETLDVKEAVRTAEYVYTDTWINMEFFDNPEYKAFKDERIATMMPFQINRELLKDSKAKIMHDMPIHPGFEIAEDCVDDPRSIIYDQAENRLEAQKAIMVYLLEKM